MEFTVKGRRYSLTKQAVEERLRDVQPEPVVRHAVVIEGRVFPPKQVLAEALGIDRLSFTTAQARDILDRLGFELMRRQE